MVAAFGGCARPPADGSLRSPIRSVDAKSRDHRSRGSGDTGKHREIILVILIGGGKTIDKYLCEKSEIP